MSLGQSDTSKLASGPTQGKDRPGNLPTNLVAVIAELERIARYGDGFSRQAAIRALTHLALWGRSDA